jgi:hypothetical protein
MVPTPSTFLPTIPFQPTTTRLIIVKSNQENYKQESNQQHGLRSRYLIVFLWCKGCVFHLKDEGVKGQS